MVIDSNELHCFTEEVVLNMSISTLTVGSNTRCETLSDRTTVTGSLWLPAMGILTSSNVFSVFTSLPVQENYVLVLLSLQFSRALRKNAKY